MTALAEDTAIVPPATVAVDRAMVKDQGVEVTWLEAAAGSFPVQTYIIERNRNHGGFQEVGRAEKDSRSYLDTEGVAGDQYLIVVEDNQSPANRSGQSEIITATVVSPGNVQTMATVDTQSPSIGRPINFSSPESPSASSLASHAATFEGTANGMVSNISKALDSNKLDVAASQVNLLQIHNRQTLALMSQLSQQQRTAAVQNCQKQSSTLEADFHILPENTQMNGLLALASCEAIQDTTP